MHLISYAQNGEDVLLWRALRDIGPGFYIDVGANDPEENSVTKIFYDAGWRGINIEPMPSYHEVLRRERPRDINLALACGAADGSITLFDTPDVNGWASTDAATAAAHRADGVAIVETEVPLRTLAGICADHAPADIHFLKIDVEGFEAEVLRGMDLQRWRPWILVIEATLPNSTSSRHEDWEHLVTPHGYQFAFFDGLNRYYVAAEQARLLPALAVPANVFDHYIVHDLDKAWRRIGVLEERLAQLQQQSRTQIAVLQQQADAAEATRRDTAVWARQLEANLQAVHASWSWRLTRPLRSVVHHSRHGRLAPWLTGARRLLLGGPRRAVLAVAQIALVRRLSFALLRRYPGPAGRVLAWYGRVRGAGPSFDTPGVPAAIAHLPQSARRVLADLEQTELERTQCQRADPMQHSSQH